MSSPIRASAARTCVSLAATVALLLCVQVASASATPEISLSSPSVAKSSLLEPFPTIGITGTGFEAYEEDDGDLRAGICTQQVFGIPPILAPACGLYTEVTVTAGGNLSGELVLESVAPEEPLFTNEHLEKPPLQEQPANVDCTEEQLANRYCEIIVVDHSTSPVPLDSEIIEFTPYP